MRDWHDILKTCDLQNWKEALAAVMTYAQPEEFSSLCGQCQNSNAILAGNPQTTSTPLTPPSLPSQTCSGTDWRRRTMPSCELRPACVTSAPATWRNWWCVGPVLRTDSARSRFRCAHIHIPAVSTEEPSCLDFKFFLFFPQYYFSLKRLPYLCFCN